MCALVPPKITPFSFGDDPMNQDEPVSISCTISGGDLPIKVKWTLNGGEIESWHEILTETRGKRINVLMIESLKAKHAGFYACLAENAAGVVEHTSELIVNGQICEKIVIVIFLLISFSCLMKFCVYFCYFTDFSLF